MDPAADLVTAMQGKDCLKGWDMLMGFDLDTVNGMLSQIAVSEQSMHTAESLDFTARFPGK